MIKNLQFIFVLGTLLFSLNGISQTNNLVVFIQESKPFYVVLNGVRQNMEPETNVKITDLKGEFYKVKVIFADGQTEDVDKTISFMEMGKQYSMEVIDKRGKYRLRFAGEIDIASSTNEDGQSQVAYHEQPIENTQVSTGNTGNSTTTTNTSTTSTSTTSGTASGSVNTNNNGSNTQVNVNSGTDNPSATINVKVSETGINMNTQVNDGGQVSSTQTNAQVNNGTGSQQATIVTTYSGMMNNGTMCSSPTLDQKSFLDFKYDIESENMFSRQEFILKVFKANCMTSQQVAEIINLDYSTVDAAEIAKQGYRYTWDTQNYGTVLNAISSSIKRDEAAKFLNLTSTSTSSVSTTTTTTTTSSTTTNGGSVTINTDHSGSEYYGTEYNENNDLDNNSSSRTVENQGFISLVDGYDGTIGCVDGLLIDEKAVKKAADNESFSDDKMNVIKQASKNKCYSVNQVVSIASTFSFEKDKVEFVKWAYDKTYDVDDYFKVNELFTFSASKDEVNKFVESQPDKGYGGAYSGTSSSVPLPNYTGTIGCFDPVIDGNKLKSMVAEESFSDDQLNVIKQALKNKCITVEQFKSIAKELSFEKDIVEFAKVAYPQTYDQDNFYEINSILTHSSSKKEINKIINQ